MPEPQSKFYVKPQRGRVSIRAELHGDLMSWLTVHLLRCQRAIDRINRTAGTMGDGGVASSPFYYIHARSYLLQLLTCVSDSVAVADLLAAQELVIASAEHDDTLTPPPPLMGPEGSLDVAP